MIAPPAAVSLQAPLYLMLLAAAPLAVWLYVRHERSGARGRAAFASPALLPAVAPRRPGWRRHLPMALYLAALAVLVLALARPQVTVAVPVDQARIILVLDQSGSMRSTDVAPSRIVAARRAAGAFLARVPRRVQVGAVAFGTSARVIQGPTTDRQAVRAALAAVTPKGTTGTGDALQLALTVARRPVAPGAKPPPAAIVLLSDGKWDNGRDPIAVARTAARDHVPIYAVSLGTANGTITRTRHGRTRTIHVPPDPQAMQQIATASKAQAFDVRAAPRLTAVYRRLGSQLTHHKAQRQITSGVAGGALALVVIAGSLSLLWFGRLP